MADVMGREQGRVWTSSWDPPLEQARLQAVVATCSSHPLRDVYVSGTSK